MNSFLPAPTRLLGLVAIAGAALLLSACAPVPVAVGPEPVETAVPVEVPVEETPDKPVDDPAEDPQEVPSGSGGFWLSGLTSYADSLRGTIGEWDAEGCTVEAAIDGEFLCTGALTSAAMVAQTIDEMFAGVQEQGFTADELDALASVQDAAAAAAGAAVEWTDAQCNWEATPDCTPAGEDVLSTARGLHAALEAWAA